MRIIEPHQLHQARKKSRLIKLSIFGLLALMIVVTTLSTIAYYLPIPVASATTVDVKIDTQKIALAWPTYGQAAIGAVGYGLLTQSGLNRPVPMASVAKTMTALAVLKQKPLVAGKAGPTITLSQADLDMYNSYVAKNGSVVAIEVGESLSERQALEAMLLPSANNMADSLADWAFGSVNNYLDYANNLAKSLGLKDTHIADASGFLPATVSTASDLVLLGQAVMQTPDLAQIVNEQTAAVPVVGLVRNTNYLLGQEGLVGIKTGNTDEAGGCFLLALNHAYNGKTITIIGAVLGAPTLYKAMNDGLKLATSATAGFGSSKVISTGQEVGYYNTYDERRIIVVAQKDISVFGWLGQAHKTQVKLNKLSYPVVAEQETGSVSVENQSVPVVISASASGPSWRWRLSRWF